MKRLGFMPLAGGLLLCTLAAVTRCAEAVDVPGLVRVVNSVGPVGEGHSEAIAACRQLLTAEADQIPAILNQLKPDAPLAANWIGPVVEAIAQRELDAKNELPVADLEHVLADTSIAPRARRIAYELLVRVRPQAKQQLVRGLLNDPSPELRRDAVALALEKAKATLDSGSPVAAVAAYRTALTAARDQDQIDEAAKQLRELGETVDLARHFGFIQQWRWVGPFDNKDMKGFDVAYGPETDASSTSEYEGKEGRVAWATCKIEDDYGMVDLNEIAGKLKAAIVYACAEFVAEQAQDVDLRLGCITANKVWLNGELLTATNVYHSGTYIDQYVGKGRLKPGKNVILVKVLQNEQTEDWAQRWQFQLRVCDRHGTAVLTSERGEETQR